MPRSLESTDRSRSTTHSDNISRTAAGFAFALTLSYTSDCSSCPNQSFSARLTPTGTFDDTAQVTKFPVRPDRRDADFFMVASIPEATCYLNF
jgi:hypothetical protein